MWEKALEIDSLALLHDAIARVRRQAVLATRQAAAPTVCAVIPRLSANQSVSRVHATRPCCWIDR